MSSSKLLECFRQVIFQEDVKLDLSVVKDIMERELFIRLEKLDPNLIEILPRMFVVYATSWPGWNQLNDENIGLFSDWFVRFKKYLELKLNYVILNGYQEAQKMANETIIKNQTGGQGTQTDNCNLTVPDSAPFSLKISCSPEIMNRLAFKTSDNSPNDLVLRLHPSVKRSNISFTQLLNWPFVEIIFISPEFKFTRKNVSEYKRYVGLIPNLLPNDKEEFISNVDQIKPVVKRNSYTLKFFEEYIHAYMDILTKIKNINPDSIQDESLIDIKIILKHFLLDIQEISIKNSMATNTKVTFNIGKNHYLRLKTFLTENGSVEAKYDVAYFEFITPRIELGLEYFTAKQDKTTPGIHFIYLNELKSQLPNVNFSTVVPQVYYRCNFCNKGFYIRSALLDHLLNIHKYEQNVVCYKCKVSFPLTWITQFRWSHSCEAVNTDT